MRGVALAVAIGMIGCGGGASQSPPGMDGSQWPADAVTDVIDGGAGDPIGDTTPEGGASKPITFQMKLDASIPPGTEVHLSARAYGWGHPAPDCNGRRRAVRRHAGRPSPGHAVTI